MIKSQKKLIIIFAALFVVMVVLYFTVISPLLVGETAETEPLETVAGEAIGPNNRYLMFEHVEKSSIQSIEVFNEYGSYKFYRDAADDFQLEGYEGMSYNQELFSSLVVSSGYTLAMMKVMDNATEADLAEYGLDDPIAHWVLTTTTGDVHTVYVGDNLITEGGYYVQYEGRDSVYILSTSLANTILQPVEKLMTPLLTAGMSTNDYFYATNFTIWHGEELFLRIANVPEAEKVNADAIVETEMVYPTGYQPNDNLYFEVLYGLMALQGTETVKIGTTDEILDEYGLLDPAHSVYYEFQDYAFYLSFSEKQADGTYYASSSLYNDQMIVKIDASTISWLEKSLFSWIAEYPFNVNITQVKKLTVQAEGLDVTFDFTHGTTDSGSAVLDIEADVRAAKESTAPSVVYIPDAEVYNFRQFYKSLLAIKLEEYTPLTDEEKEELTADDSKLILNFSYTTIDGETFEYKFYQYSTRRAFVTINGYGEFYTLIDHINKIASDTEKVLVAMDINSYGKK